MNSDLVSPISFTLLRFLDLRYSVAFKQWQKHTANNNNKNEERKKKEYIKPNLSRCFVEVSSFSPMEIGLLIQSVLTVDTLMPLRFNSLFSWFYVRLAHNLENTAFKMQN